VVSGQRSTGSVPHNAAPAATHRTPDDGVRTGFPWVVFTRVAKEELKASDNEGIAHMPRKTTLERAEKAAREGKRPTTQAGEFVREEIEHVREGKHGARSTKQAIAIGLSKARRAGVKLPPPEKGTVSEKTQKSAERAYREGQTARKKKPSAKRSRATLDALKREGRSAASKTALSRQARTAARTRSARKRAKRS
jgi:hypothetical protein